MSGGLPEYYFRTRENGAMVFRVDTENRQRRMELEHIAVVNVRNGEIRPQGDRTLSVAERAAIEAWMVERREALVMRELQNAFLTIEHLNQTTHWAQTKATSEELESVTDSLLLAMHDLRSVLVRKKADRLAKR